MTQAPPAVFKIPTKSPQAARGVALRPARSASGQVRASGTGRAATRGGGEVIELEHGITVYPARSEGGRWRAVWHEAGRREQCEAASEEKLAAKLELVKARLAADAPNMRRLGADLIVYYLDPDRLPVSARWSRKHAHTQRRLCERFAAPVIAAVACQDIKTEHTQAIVNAAPTAGEGDRVRGTIAGPPHVPPAVRQCPSANLQPGKRAGSGSKRSSPCRRSRSPRFAPTSGRPACILV